MIKDRASKDKSLGISYVFCRFKPSQAKRSPETKRRGHKLQESIRLTSLHCHGTVIFGFSVLFHVPEHLLSLHESSSCEWPLGTKSCEDSWDTNKLPRKKEFIFIINLRTLRSYHKLEIYEFRKQLLQELSFNQEKFISICQVKIWFLIKKKKFEGWY